MCWMKWTVGQLIDALQGIESPNSEIQIALDGTYTDSFRIEKLVRTKDGKWLDPPLVSLDEHYKGGDRAVTIDLVSKSHNSS